MSSIKERIFGAVTVMSEEDAQKVWDLTPIKMAILIISHLFLRKICLKN